jgi:hypothetical protein
MFEAKIYLNGKYNGRLRYESVNIKPSEPGVTIYDFHTSDGTITIRQEANLTIELDSNDPYSKPPQPEPKPEPLKGEVTGRSIDINNLIIGDRLDRNFIISLYWLRQALQKSNYDRLIILAGQFAEHNTTIYDQPVKDDC